MIFGRWTHGAYRPGGATGARPRPGCRLLTPGILALALILALLLGGGLNLLAHHDHSLITSDNDCAACRVLETPGEAAPLQPEGVALPLPRYEAPAPPSRTACPEDPATALDRPRGPPAA